MRSQRVKKFTEIAIPQAFCVDKLMFSDFWLKKTYCCLGDECFYEVVADYCTVYM
jgi:hypothetical protein